MMRRRVAQARVARLATVGADARPHVVPVCFTVEDDTLTFVVDHKPKTSNTLRRVENIRANPLVSLIVDQYDEDWDHLWWVRLDGRATIVETDDGSFDAVVDPLLEKYRGQYGLRPLPGPGRRHRHPPLGRLVRDLARSFVLGADPVTDHHPPSGAPRELDLVADDRIVQELEPRPHGRRRSQRPDVLDDDLADEVPDVLTRVRLALGLHELLAPEAVTQFCARQRPQRREVEVVPRRLVGRRDVVGRRARDPLRR